MKILTYEDMLTALHDRDGSYDGLFWIGVRTTGIYCLPSCRAKKPLLKNVTFFATRQQAIDAGLRGCKRCRAEFYPNTSPPWLEHVLALMRSALSNRLNETHLSETAGVDISTIRRYFKQYLNTTPMAYHRRMRLKYASQLLRSGTSYLAAAYECGFESSNGFRDAFIKEFGQPPGRYYA
jgi:AraC family transcriptional regulator of adaptative response/methylated-DNA-[protein]-cysteine methyltransferase